MNYGMLINYGLCTGCESCVISCRKEKDLSLDEWGMRVEQVGPKRLGGQWEWDYLPVPSRLCDLCSDLREQGRVSPCQRHCLAQVIEILPMERIAGRMEELGGRKVTCFMP